MTAPSFITVAEEAAAEFSERKSRFIGQISPAADEAAAARFIARVRVRHGEARHHCYAWVTGENNCFQRSSDDGEPSGTAGRPILEALKRAGLSNTALVVSRYFGGVLLGAGGLTRAYAKAAQLAVEAALLVRHTLAGRYALLFDYPLLGRVEAFLLSKGYYVESKQYAAQVCIICLIEDERVAAARQALADLSGGVLELRSLGQGTIVALL